MSAQIPEAAGTGEDLAAYYAARATEYDAIYARVERQPDIERLGSMLCELLHMRSVLEIACGTGYWTQRYAQHARKVLATDVNEAVLAIARDRLSAFSGASVERVDAFALEPLREHPGAPFDAALAMFWWSHLSASRLRAFLSSLRQVLALDARLVFADNRYVQGSSTPISRVDADGNSYQQRRLADGRTFEVMKNFPTAQAVAAELEAIGLREVRVESLRYFWVAEGRLAPA